VADTPLTLSGTVIPANATKTAIVWSLGAGSTAPGAAVTGGQAIASGAGTVEVTATVINGISPSRNYTQHFTVTFSPPPPPTFNVYVNQPVGGNVSASASTAPEDQTVIITATAFSDYELMDIDIRRNDNGQSVDALFDPSTGDCSFFMPASDVTATATFQKTDVYARWERAKAIIENTPFSLSQDEAGDPAFLHLILAEIINRLIAPTGITVSPGDIVIFSHREATAGDDANPSGVNGSFGFRVSPPGLNNSAYASGEVTATIYDITGNMETWRDVPLRAWTHDGTLHVSGLTAGQKWAVYNLYGVLIYQSVADSEAVAAVLPGSGAYIVTDGKAVIKVVN